MNAFAMDYIIPVDTVDENGQFKSFSHENYTQSVNSYEAIRLKVFLSFIKVGGGSINVLSDSKGNFTGFHVNVKVAFQDSFSENLGYSELSSGRSLEFTKDNNKPSIIFEKAGDVSVNGGTFRLKLLNELSSGKYTNYIFKVSKKATGGFDITQDGAPVTNLNVTVNSDKVSFSKTSFF